MKIKFFQLNILQGMLLDDIIEFVKKNDFDILHFQEVTSGDFSEGGVHHYPKEHPSHGKNDLPNLINAGLDCFEEIKKRLGYEGFLVKNAEAKDSAGSYFGSATFYKSNFKVKKEETLVMSEKHLMDDASGFFPRDIGRSAIALLFSINGKKVWFINTHLLWGPNPYDDAEKLKDGRKFVGFVRKLGEPFLISGDFNVISSSEIVTEISKISTNHVEKHNIANTLNPEIHPAKYLFPDGLAVDYIFTSPEIETSNFKLIDKPNLSDHFGLSIEMEA